MINKRILFFSFLVIITLSLSVCTTSSVSPKEDIPEKTYFAVDMQGKIIGYSEESEYDDIYKGVKVRVLHIIMFIKMSLLGQPVDQRVEQKFFINRHSQKPIFYSFTSERGSITKQVECVFNKETVYCKSFTNGDLTNESVIKLAPDVVTLCGNRVMESLAASLDTKEPGETKELKLFIPAAFEMDEEYIGTITFEGKEILNIQNKELHTRRYLLIMSYMGTKMKFWISSDSGRIIRVDNRTSNLSVYETDPTIVTMLKRAEITDSILIQTNEQIENIKLLTRMNLEVEIAAPGKEISVSSLNVPGQKFKGTVEDNTIRGIFEIEPIRYTGKGAPGFPPLQSNSSDLIRYLEPESGIESSHSEIVTLAKELSKDASDSWEAAVLFAEWIHENIIGDIPGGGTALGSLRTKRAECGGHSRLHTALCRAIGIPARLVTGGMYILSYGGSFGQHVWVEVYMSEAGWIPIDATAGETDSIDAGHIRLGELNSFNPKKITILDYEPKIEEKQIIPETRPSPYAIGKLQTFHFILKGENIGKQIFKIDKQAMYMENEAFFFTSDLSFKGYEGTSETIIDLTGHPLYYHIKGKTSSMEYEIECTFEDDKVKTRIIKDDVDTETTINLPKNVLLFDNNNIGHFAMMFSRFELLEGKEFTIKAFHPSSLSVLPLQVKVENLEKILVREIEYYTFNVKIVIVGNELNIFLTKEGMLIKDVEQGGELIIEYEPPTG